MMRPVRRVYSMIAADPNGVCLTQTPSAGGVQLLSINGILSANGAVALDVGQHATITGGAETARTFTVTGKDQRGIVISEDITGPSSNTVITTRNFQTITSVSVDDNTAGAITVGINNTAELPWIPLDRYGRPDYAYAVDITTATFEIQSTVDNVEDVTVEPSVFATVEASGAIDVTGNSVVPCTAIRAKVTAFTAGDVIIKLFQMGDD